jgi:hypothetical protein
MCGKKREGKGREGKGREGKGGLGHSFLSERQEKTTQDRDKDKKVHRQDFEI